MTEKVVLKINLTIAEYRRDRNISIYIWLTFSHVTRTYQVVDKTNRAIWKNVATGDCVLQTSVNDGTLRSTANLASHQF